MSSSFEKSVKGGTKVKLAAPKSKYVEHILVATHAGEAGVAEIFRTMQHRLRDSTWTVVFKSLIIVHLMIREGEPNVTLKYLSESPRNLAISGFSDGAYDPSLECFLGAGKIINACGSSCVRHGQAVQVQGANIRHYSEYLVTRARSFHDTKLDHVRSGEGRLKRLSVDKGLLRETESVQSQIRALVKCDFFKDEPENEITLTAFRLVTMDLLALYAVMNEGTINVLEHYFEMSKYDAERALEIYITFAKQTDQVVQFLSFAREYEQATRLEIPKLKHAPTGLTHSLEEYINDPDFELNRRQYLAQQEAKKSGRNLKNSSKKSEPPKSSGKSTAAASDFPDPPKPAGFSSPSQPAKGPAPDLIDFFESIENNQQPMTQQATQQGPGFQQMPQQPFQQVGFGPQPTGFPTQQQQAPQQPWDNAFSQSTNPFGQPQPQQLQPPPQPLQPDFTGAGFGGYTPQPQLQPFGFQNTGFASIPENGVVASFSSAQQPAPQPQLQAQDPQSTNPFRKSVMPQATGSPFQPSQQTSPISLSRQSTNPFAKHSQPATPSPQPPQSSFSGSPSPFQSSPPQPPQIQVQPPAPLQPTKTGTNPFAKSYSPQPVQQPLQAQPTGSTNPFRQSMFQTQQPTGTLGGFNPESIPTMPVFPRQGQPAGQPWP
ncbi:MAG: hypothetical protein M1834_003581 [Cirrosporium novae-zelandiae]|nr:MAG: hypothetical protein M1834_003581 [Cirrosporium novae-zelandiae]